MSVVNGYSENSCLVSWNLNADRFYPFLMFQFALSVCIFEHVNPFSAYSSFCVVNTLHFLYSYTFANKRNCHAKLSNFFSSNLNVHNFIYVYELFLFVCFFKFKCAFFTVHTFVPINQIFL